MFQIDVWTRLDAGCREMKLPGSVRRPDARGREDSMLDLLFAAGTGAATLLGYLKSRQFVRERLRFVDAAHKPTAPVIAGAAAAVVAAPVVWLLPVVGAPAAVIFGIGVGWGVHHGSRDSRKRLPGS